MRLTKANLDYAASVFAVANTPFFVARKLRNDPVVLKLANEYSGSELVEKLEAALSRPPSTIQNAVIPYVYLVALAAQQDSSHLDRARRLNGARHDWYTYLSQALYEATMPTNTETVSVHSRDASVIEPAIADYQFSNYRVI